MPCDPSGVASSLSQVTVASRAATSLVSFGAMMSMPSWGRVQPERQAPKVSVYDTGPATGKMIWRTAVSASAASSAADAGAACAAPMATMVTSAAMARRRVVVVTTGLSPDEVFSCSSARGRPGLSVAVDRSDASAPRPTTSRSPPRRSPHRSGSATDRHKLREHAGHLGREVLAVGAVVLEHRSAVPPCRDGRPGVAEARDGDDPSIPRRVEEERERQPAPRWWSDPVRRRPVPATGHAFEHVADVADEGVGDGRDRVQPPGAWTSSPPTSSWRRMVNRP